MIIPVNAVITIVTAEVPDAVFTRIELEGQLTEQPIWVAEYKSDGFVYTTVIDAHTEDVLGTERFDEDDV